MYRASLFILIAILSKGSWAKSCATDLLKLDIDGAVASWRNGDAEAYRQQFKQLQKAKISDNHLVNSQGSFPLEELDTSHAHSNEGIYRLTLPGGRRSVLKISNLPLNPGLVASQKGFWGELQGVRLGAEVGGPQVYEFGRIDSGSGHTSGYIAMEELFPGEKVSLLKEQPGSIGRRDSRHVTVAHKLGSMLATAFEHGIQIEDMDAMVSQSGEVRWIDTQAWKPLTDQKQLVDDFRRKLITWMRTGNHQSSTLGRDLLSGFFSTLKKSTTLSDPQKLAFIHKFLETSEWNRSELLLQLRLSDILKKFDSTDHEIEQRFLEFYHDLK